VTEGGHALEVEREPHAGIVRSPALILQRLALVYLLDHALLGACSKAVAELAVFAPRS
jgi:hypothetical protein